MKSLRKYFEGLEGIRLKYERKNVCVFNSHLDQFLYNLGVVSETKGDISPRYQNYERMVPRTVGFPHDG